MRGSATFFKTDEDPEEKNRLMPKKAVVSGAKGLLSVLYERASLPSFANRSDQPFEMDCNLPKISWVVVWVSYCSTLQPTSSTPWKHLLGFFFCISAHSLQFLSPLCEFRAHGTSRCLPDLTHLHNTSLLPQPQPIHLSFLSHNTP